jgi:hypothetical protein
MANNFRHSLLVALMLGFIPASVMSVFAVPMPPNWSSATPQAATQDSLYKRLGGYDAPWPP